MRTECVISLGNLVIVSEEGDTDNVLLEIKSDTVYAPLEKDLFSGLYVG